MLAALKQLVPFMSVDVEVEDADGEFNVYVDAASGKLMLVNIEYWVIGRPAAEDNDG